MIAYDDGWLLEVFAMRIADREPDARNAVPSGDESRIVPKNAMHGLAPLLQILFDQTIEESKWLNDEDGGYDEEQESVCGAQESHESSPNG